MVQRGLILAAMLLACLSLGSAVNAADTDMKEIMARLKALEEKNKQLETKLKQAEARPSVTSAVDRAMAASDAKMSSVITSPDPHGRALKIGGYVDFSYQYNLTRPDNQRNNLRVFDNDSNGFNLHLAEINFERLPTKPGQAGFRIDLAAGTDARFTASQDNSATANSRGDDWSVIDLQQAYISYIADIGNGITIDGGKFVTWSGAEVIEAADNMNASRSLLFNYAIPIAHTGIRATYDVFKGGGDCGKWTVGLGLVNGWDNIQDQNNAKTAIFMSNWQATKWFNWVITGAVGDEQFVDERLRLQAATAGATLTSDAADFEATFDDPAVPGIGSTLTGKRFDSHDSNPRVLLDTTMTFTPWEKFTIAINADWAHEGGVPQFNGPRNRTWWGVAGYIKYQFCKNWYVANRLEYFNDEHGVRTGRNQTIWENTLTVDWALSDPMHIRFEYRHDDSNVNSYSDTKGVGNGGVNLARPFRSDSQDTLMMQWLYKF
ncbi:MAG TPA: outer membrane beta-barrel protein [Planctomycetota bacterium]|nr:outer membrane beta-barrel protein [Planctomycetota bacterium]